MRCYICNVSLAPSLLLLHLHPLCCRPLAACSPHQTSDRPAQHKRMSGPATHHTADLSSPRCKRHGHGGEPALWQWPVQTLETQRERQSVCVGLKITEVSSSCLEELNSLTVVAIFI